MHAVWHALCSRSGNSARHGHARKGGALQFCSSRVCQARVASRFFFRPDSLSHRLYTHYSIMQFFHSSAIWRDHPTLAAGVLHVTSVRPDLPVQAAVQRFQAQATARLAGVTESELPEVQAWRRTFSAMGLKPTQYRCAAESLLRRFRKEGDLPAIHPLVDLCNAVSIAFAIPIAVFDLAQVEGGLEVRPATGNERYLAFSGEEERPESGEVVFVDDAGHAHARRWTHRQSARSAIRPTTASVLIVAEALHASAHADAGRLLDTLGTELRAAGCAVTHAAVLDAAAPRFVF
jgi:DNA/RNA-binding domain of Phe-tRNA-synthetase-like protein